MNNNEKEKNINLTSIEAGKYSDVLNDSNCLVEKEISLTLKAKSGVILVKE